VLDKKHIVTFGVIVVTFTFFPSENWDYWFLGDKAEHYAEYSLRGDKQSFVVAKNVFPASVYHGLAGVVAAFSAKIGEGQMNPMRSDAPIPPNSVALLEIAPSATLVRMAHTSSPEYSFAPMALTLVAPVEEGRWMLLAVALMAVTALLAFSIGGLMREDDRQRELAPAGSRPQRQE
jgi:hypothetical protein